MWQFIRDYHFYRPEEKRAILVLFSLILLTIGVTIGYEHMHTPPPVDETALQSFADSIQRQDSIMTARRSRRNEYQRSNAQPQRQRGSYAKSYTAPRREKVQSAPKSKDTVVSLLLDTLPRYEKVEKYALGTVVDLNKADTTELKKIPGIGSAIARMIVNYRNQLGGFYAVGQLRDIHIDANQLLVWLSIDEADIKKIKVNKSSVDRLRRHPYLNFYQAKAIVEHRRKHGDLLSLKPLILYDEFSENDLERLSHYVSFD
ncbi:MAG: helix-hairpin-helix domain-containing protein [Bacteroidaceae bacterium]|nr:helix-hairpin-helix domain-containing protein [Bacteroidaceae bacterium]